MRLSAFRAQEKMPLASSGRRGGSWWSRSGAAAGARREVSVPICLPWCYLVPRRAGSGNGWCVRFVSDKMHLRDGGV